jgi:hypothetical protein
VDSFEDLFSAVAVQIFVSQIDEDQVDVSSARDDLVTEILESFCQPLCVQNNLIRGKSVFEADFHKLLKYPVGKVTKKLSA